jgi:hypothetical protein
MINDCINVQTLKSRLDAKTDEVRLLQIKLESAQENARNYKRDAREAKAELACIKSELARILETVRVYGRKK